MRSLCRLNSRGITLVELLVAMALSAMLLATVVYGGLFLEKYINHWRDQALLSEEIVIVRQTLGTVVRDSRRVTVTDSSIVCLQLDGSVDTLIWSDGLFKKNGTPLLRRGVLIDSLSFASLQLLREAEPDILTNDTVDTFRGLYQVTVALTDRSKYSRVATFVVRNRYEVVSFNH